VTHVVIVDDEPPARAELRRLLSVHDGVNVVAEAGDADEAVSLITRHRPDLVLLDIELGGASGFDVLAKVPQPVDVIFVTAYDQYAIRAFEVSALDYLLKPVRPERLAAALSRRAGRSMTGTSAAPLTADDHIFVPLRRHWAFIRVADIAFIRAEGNYSRVVVRSGEETLMRRSLREWLQRLPHSFVQIHRATVVNVEHVERVEAYDESRLRVRMRMPQQALALSRRYASALQARFA
jgi:two-component system, LytTR family, response regulator